MATDTAKIDEMFRRMQEIPICQDHWKLVGMRLDRLKQTLNHTELSENEERSQQSMMDLLEVIEKIIVHCHQNDTHPNGLTYGDLESLLFRIQERLAQYEAANTNDYDQKIQIINDAYQERHTLMQKTVDETLKQQLTAIEQSTKEQTIAQLRQLRETYAAIIESYLRRCIEMHQTISLTDLTDDTVAEIGQSVYQATFDQQSQLKNNWQTFRIPLHNPRLQFKPDGYTTIERNEIQAQKETFKSLWQSLAWTAIENTVKEEEIIRSKRWVAILGEPGSGKTSFVRRLVRHLAETYLANEKHASDYGLLRIPILIHLEEFVEIVNMQPTLTLFDYIGKHKWMKCFIVNDSSISTDDLSSALQDYIKHGQALIILDGLDEIPEPDQRSKIIRMIENFVDTYAQIPTGASALDNIQLTRLFDDPSRSGGNQLIVTSRTTECDATLLPGQFAHYTIQPLKLNQIEEFIDYWFSSMHQYIIDTLRLTTENRGNAHGEVLKEELKKSENTNLLAVASNCSLLATLCTISFNQQNKSALPLQRILLYEKLTHVTLLSWNSKRSIVLMPELIRILSDIAYAIHQRGTLKYISKEEIIEICSRSVQQSSGRARDEIESQISQLTHIILEYIGFLIPQNGSSYAFPNQIFQEYFTSQKFINIRRTEPDQSDADTFDRHSDFSVTAELFHKHVQDPHFRTPIGLALGKISSMWFAEEFNELCRIFLPNDHGIDSLCTLVGSFNELLNYPSDEIMFDLFDRLLIVSSKHRWSNVCPFLDDHIIKMLKRLSKESVISWVNRFLSRCSSNDIQLVSTFCHLIEGKAHEFENIQWLDQAACSILQSMSKFDNEMNQFAIDRLLIKVAFSNPKLLPVRSNTFKEFLLNQTIELTEIPTLLLPLIITLYGGLKRDNQTVTFDSFHIHRESAIMTPMLVRSLSADNRSKQDPMIKLKQEIIQTFLSHIKKHDESDEMIDLCIATLCVCDIEYVKNNHDIIPFSLLKMTIDRLKYISMILRQFYFPSDENDRSVENQISQLIATAIDKFHYGDSSRIQFLDFLHLLKSDMARLRSSSSSALLDGRSNVSRRITLTLPNNFKKGENLFASILLTDTRFDGYRQSCSLLPRFLSLFHTFEIDQDFDTVYQTAVAMDTVPEYIFFRNDRDLFSSLAYTPSHLQNLYLRLLKQKFISINPNDLPNINKQHLYFGHILTECLMYLSNASCNRLSLYTSLLALLPWLRIQQLDIFGSSLQWTVSTKDSTYLGGYELTRQHPMNNITGRYTGKRRGYYVDADVTDEQRRAVIDEYIKEECQRFQNAKSTNTGDSMQLYASAITLACICRWTDEERRQSLFEDSIHGAMLITNKLTRLDALCVIAFYSNSSQILINTGRTLLEEIEHQLNESYPTLPLLLHATIFLRCLPLLQHQQTIDKCLENLYSKFGDTDLRDRQAVNEALLPYILSTNTFSSVKKFFPYDATNETTTITTKSPIVRKYLTVLADDNLSSSVLMSNLYLLQLTHDLYECLKVSEQSLNIDELLITFPLHFNGPTLTEAEALILTNFLHFAASTEQSGSLGKVLVILDNALHRMSFIEFKARTLLESWLKWKDSNEFCSFAYHAALLLANSELWSVNVATILCDLLCCESDRFRQRTHVILQSHGDDVNWTTSKLGFNVVLTLAEREANYRKTSAAFKLILYRFLGNIIIDNQSHLETLLWMERYRIHALNNEDYCLSNSRPWKNMHLTSCLSNNVTSHAYSFINLLKLSGDSCVYVCDMIASNFFSFSDIDGDTSSDSVVQSHNQFVISVIIRLFNEFNNTEETRQTAIEALTDLFTMSGNDEIRIAIAYALGYMCNRATYRSLFEKIQEILCDLNSDTPMYSNAVLIAFISSYTYCIAVHGIAFDQNDIDLFSILLQHTSQDIVKAARNGFGRAIKETSFLCETLGSNPLQCYHALIEATAYLFIYDVQQNSEIAVADFVEQYPTLLPIFNMELYNSIRHFTDQVIPLGGVKYILAYGCPQYVKVASLIAVKMPETFCTSVKQFKHGDDLKRAIYYTSKQHNFPQRAACLTILSVFGELTIELCEMMIRALFDDPHLQNTCYNCITRIHTVKDEKAVTDYLYSHLKSKSMNVRYLVAMILLYLVQSSLLPYEQVRSVLSEVMLDPSSNEDLWLIEDDDAVFASCAYHYTGQLKDVIYLLLIQHSTGNKTDIVPQKELNDIESDFVRAQRASRLASCLYGKQAENKTKKPSSLSSVNSITSDEEEKPSDLSVMSDNDDDDDDE
ncbi:unnamed protein product [Adineta ricciae]|uniref:NACHT domain-containing protein n=1 Tax=Adineta ricciae TaxID=249248 RepID=A0A813TDP0_ADIRI|nr:unnamed protein product [Adineta ricciae]CAF1028195.1 unnamed protein product [Adineta ricciae]